MHYETKHVYIEIINYYLLTIFFVNQKYFIIYIHKRKWSLYNCLVKKIFKRIFFFFKCLKGLFDFIAEPLIVSVGGSFSMDLKY